MKYKQIDKNRKRNKPIGLRLSERELKRLTEIAQSLELNRTQVIAMLINNYQ